MHSQKVFLDVIRSVELFQAYIAKEWLFGLVDIRVPRMKVTSVCGIRAASAGIAFRSRMHTVCAVVLGDPLVVTLLFRGLATGRLVRIGRRLRHVPGQYIGTVVGHIGHPSGIPARDILGGETRTAGDCIGAKVVAS